MTPSPERPAGSWDFRSNSHRGWAVLLGRWGPASPLGVALSRAHGPLCSFPQRCAFLLEGCVSSTALGVSVHPPQVYCAQPTREGRDGAVSAQRGSTLTASLLSSPSASQTEYIPLHVPGKSLTLTDERETIQQSLNRYRAASPPALALPWCRRAGAEAVPPSSLQQLTVSHGKVRLPAVHK